MAKLWCQAEMEKLTEVEWHGAMERKVRAGHVGQQGLWSQGSELFYEDRYKPWKRCNSPENDVTWQSKNLDGGTGVVNKSLSTRKKIQHGKGIEKEHQGWPNTRRKNKTFPNWNTVLYPNDKQSKAQLTLL